MLIFYIFIATLYLPTVASRACQTFVDDVVRRHNVIRALHGSPPVVEDKDLSAYAQEWAEYLAANNEFMHRPNNKYGENLSWMWPRSKGSQHVDYLYSEEQANYAAHGFYNKEPTVNDFNTIEIGHFTQMVWAGTRRIGVGKAGGIVVINYDPPGNVLGYFGENVEPR